MKKFLHILAFASVLTGICDVFAQKPVYIYRNEGYISTFITDEIDSITYSRLDADSILQPDYCMTEIHACDTIFRIPIASIDSISFITPPTVLRPGVFNIDDELLPWVTDCNDLTIGLKGSTPHEILPKAGETIVSISNIENPIGGFFLGRVTEVTIAANRITIQCAPASFADGFVRYYGCMTGIVSSESAVSRAENVPPGWGTWTPAPYTYNLLEDLTQEEQKPIEDLAINFDGTEVSFTVAPSFKFHSRMVFNPPYETSIALTIIGDYNLRERISLGGNIKYDHDIKLIDASVRYGYINFFFEMGVYCRADVNLALEKEWNQYFGSTFHWEWAKDNKISVLPVNKFYHVKNEESGNYTMDGELSTGFYAKIGPRFPKIMDFDIAELSLRAEAGIGLKGKFLPLLSDVQDSKTSPDFYNKIKAQKIEAFCELGMVGEAKLFSWSASTPPDLGGIPLRTQIALNTISAVPDFSNTRIVRNADNSIFVRSDAKGYVGCNDLGFALSKDGKFAEDDYVYTWNNYKGPNASLTHVYQNKPQDTDYVIYPLVKWMGIEMIANDDACNDDSHPHNVDLGLPSGIKWSCINVGAIDPTDAGEYYKGFSGKDIATEIMGAGYATPTREQFEELLANTEQTRSKVNGVDGFIFKAKNGNSIFLPAAAQLWWDGEESSWVINNEGSGAYWTRTTSDDDYLYFLEFSHGESLPFFGDRQWERNRLPIRPIYIEQ